MTVTQQVLTVLIVACLAYVAVSTWRQHRPRRAPGRHRVTGADRDALRGADVLAAQRAATDAAQQRMAAAVRRETGR